MIARALPIALASACTFAASTSSMRSGSAAPSGSTRANAQPAPDQPESGQDLPKAPPGAIRGGGPFVDVRGFYLPVPERPVDPWAGVINGKPIALELDPFYWWSNDDGTPCTAARDHCLPAASWMWMAAGHEHYASTVVKPFVFTQEGATRPKNTMPVPGGAFIALRSVPATRATLVPGARVLAYPSKPFPDDPWNDWHVSTVTSVDWELGFVYLASAPEQPYFVSAIRIPVLRWDRDHGLQIIGGKPRDALAVHVRDVIAPP